MGELRVLFAAVAALLAGCADVPILDDSAEEPLSPLAVYRVAPGETLASISESLRVPGGWPALAELNDLSEPDRIYAGAGLIVPRTDRGGDLPAYDPLVDFAVPIYPCDATYLSVPGWPDRPDEEAGDERAIDGCDRAACVDLGADTAVCKCLHWEHRDRVSVVAGDRVVQQWRAPSYFGDLRELEVAIADLDDDGDDEIVVANLIGVSNGMAVSSWQIAILEEAGAPPLLFEVEDYGVGSLAESPEGGCDILATDWEWSLDSLDDDGTYATGRRYRYADGALHPVPDAGIHVRRLLYSFDRDFTQRPGGLCLSDVAAWFSDPRAQWRATEPALAQQRVGARYGVIRDVRWVDSQWEAEVEIEVELADFTVATVMRSAWLPDYPMQEEAFDSFVDGATRLRYPQSYRPADPATLIDASVRIETYRDSWDDLEQFIVLL